MKSKQLNHISKIIAGQSPPSSTYNYTGEGLPFFQGKTDFQEKYPTARMWCTSEHRKESYPGDILISVRAPVGAVNICNQKSIIGRGLAAIRPNADTYGLYLYYYLKANEKQIDALGTGSTFKAITQETLKKIEIPTPDFDDQKRIAHLLDTVDGLISERKRHLQQLDALLQSVFMQMFGENCFDYSNWPLVSVESLAAKHKGSMRTGTFGSNLLHSEFLPKGDVAVLGIDNAVQNRFTWGEPRFITHEKYELLKAYRVYPGDVIVTIMGTLGRVAVIPNDIPLAINTKHLAAITPDTKIIHPRFLSALLQFSPSIKKQLSSNSRGAIMAGLNLGIIKRLKLHRPPIALQNKFAVIVEKVEGIKQHYQHSLTQMENLYGVLSQKAFKGELDLSRVPEVREIALEAHWTMEATCDFGQLIADLTGLDNADKRKAIVSDWLESWVKNSPDKPLSIQDFMDNALPSIEAFIDGDEQKFYLRTAFYDDAKDWVFASLKKGTLQQTFDDTKDNAVHLHTGE